MAIWAISMRSSRFIVDLTRLVDEGMNVLPTHQKTVLFPTHQLSADGSVDQLQFNIEGLLLSDHAGTHIDAPRHVDCSGPTIDCMPVDQFIADAVCLDCSACGITNDIDATVLEKSVAETRAPLNPGDAVLLYTGHTRRVIGGMPWSRHTGVSVSGANWLIERAVSLVGCDTPSIDSSREYSQGEYPAHRILLKDHAIPILENAELELVVGRRFLLIALPLRISGASGSPVRAVGWI